MRQAVRFQTIVTVFMVIAALAPILMISLVRYREGLAAEAVAAEQAKRDMQVAVRILEHELEQVQAQFTATVQAAGGAGPLSRTQLIQLLQAPGAASAFRALYVVDMRGVTHLYYSATEGHPVFWALTEVPPPGSAVLLTAPDPDHSVYQQEGHFKAGSMGPKVEACLRFAEATGGRAVIAALAEALPAVAGEAGTQIVTEGK